MHPNHKIFLRFICGILMMCCGAALFFSIKEYDENNIKGLQFFVSVLLVITGYEWIDKATK